jgi:hypothetical protein
VGNSYITSSSSDNDDDDVDHRKPAAKKPAKFESPARSHATGKGIVVKTETKTEDEDEKGSEKERSNKKTAISMIFASSKVLTLATFSARFQGTYVGYIFRSDPRYLRWLLFRFSGLLMDG